MTVYQVSKYISSELCSWLGMPSLHPSQSPSHLARALLSDPSSPGIITAGTEWVLPGPRNPAELFSRVTITLDVPTW